MKTWHKEVAVVTAVLLSVAVARNSPTVEFIGSLAVLFTFMHAQIGFRLTEAQRPLELDPYQQIRLIQQGDESLVKESADSFEAFSKGLPTKVDCYRMMDLYFYCKEVLWFIYFLSLGAYSGLVSVGVFLLYPMWRSWHVKNNSGK